MSDNLPYPDDPGGTHYPGCWRERGHHNCAVLLADELAGLLELVESKLEICPKCRAIPVRWWTATGSEGRDPIQHRDGCALAAALEKWRGEG